LINSYKLQEKKEFIGRFPRKTINLDESNKAIVKKQISYGRKNFEKKI